MKNSRFDASPIVDWHDSPLYLRLPPAIHMLHLQTPILHEINPSLPRDLLRFGTYDPALQPHPLRCDLHSGSHDIRTELRPAEDIDHVDRAGDRFQCWIALQPHDGRMRGIDR